MNSKVCKALRRKARMLTTGGLSQTEYRRGSHPRKNNPNYRVPEGITVLHNSFRGVYRELKNRYRATRSLQACL